MMLTTSEGELRIVEESACKYKEIGIILLKDNNGVKVQAIKRAVGNDLVDVVYEIYCRWIREDEDHSWKKLTQCLRDCDLNVLAWNIEKHFQLPQPQHPKEGVLFLLRVIEKLSSSTQIIPWAVDISQSSSMYL